MAEKPTVVQFDANSPEKIALDLMRVIAESEGVLLHRPSGPSRHSASRKWILDTYAQCLHVVRGNRPEPNEGETAPKASDH